ncbi:MAG TPA: flavodoxin family protein [Conexibacter sp.]
MSFGVIGSPRADGNTAAAVDDLLAGMTEHGWTTASAVVQPQQIGPVGDCAACVRRGACTIEDGFGTLMEQVFAADTIVLGTPLYWYGASAQLKALLDRWSCLLDLDEQAFRARMRGKRTVLLVAQGERGFYEAAPCLQQLEWTARYLEIEVAGRVVVVGHARDDYRRDTAQRERVRAAGSAVAAGRAADVQPPWFHLRHTPGKPLGGIYPPG